MALESSWLRQLHVRLRQGSQICFGKFDNFGQWIAVSKTRLRFATNFDEHAKQSSRRTIGQLHRSSHCSSIWQVRSVRGRVIGRLRFAPSVADTHHYINPSPPGGHVFDPDMTPIRNLLGSQKDGAAAKTTNSVLTCPGFAKEKVFVAVDDGSSKTRLSFGEFH